MTLADLKAQLDDALKVEDYSLAARLRDAIQWVGQGGCIAECSFRERRWGTEGDQSAQSQLAAGCGRAGQQEQQQQLVV